jgi:hypothetical protein
MMQIPEIACTRKTGRAQSIKTASEVAIYNPLEVSKAFRNYAVGLEV